MWKFDFSTTYLQKNKEWFPRNPETNTERKKERIDYTILIVINKDLYLKNQKHFKIIDLYQQMFKSLPLFPNFYL